MIPIAVSVFGGMEISSILVINIASILAGAVCGDHISPISDTTILSSTGANCNHLEHVSTQTPYALFAALFSLIGFLIAGLTKNMWLSLALSVVLMLAALFLLRSLSRKKEQAVS